MGLILKTCLALLLIASTPITTCLVMASEFWVSNQEERSLEESSWSFSRFTRAANIKDTFNNVFYPMRCNPHGRNIKVCAVEDEMNETACLLIGCCFKDRHKDPCYRKTINGAKQMAHIIGIGILAVLFIALCPFLCCLMMQKTKLNPLLRKNKKVEDARKKDVEVGGYFMKLLKDQKRKRKMQQEDETKPINNEDQ